MLTVLLCSVGSRPQSGGLGRRGRGRRVGSGLYPEGRKSRGKRQGELRTAAGLLNRDVDVRRGHEDTAARR